MGDPFDARLAWFTRLSPHRPMINPGFGVDQLENAHPLEVGNGPIAIERFLQGGCIDHSMCGEPAPKQPVTDRLTEVIEQSGCKPTGCALDPPIDNRPR